MSSSDLLIAQLQRRNRIIFGIMLTALAIIALGLGLILMGKDILIPPNTGKVIQTVSSVIVAQEPIQVEADPSKTKSTSLTPSSSSSQLSQQYLPEDKQSFFSAMLNFNDDVKTKVQSFPELASSTRYLDLINKLETELVTLTDQGRYKGAMKILAINKKTIENWMAEDLEQFQQLIDEAEIAWKQKALTQLSGVISKASTLYSGEPAPLDHYRALANDWPNVSDALQRANIARTENKPDIEKQELESITLLKHDITELKERLQVVDLRLHEQQVDNLLSQIAHALIKDDVNRARINLNNLEALNPQTPEIPKFRADIEKVEEKLAFEKAMRAMDEFAAADNWADAYQVAASNRDQFKFYERFQKRANFIITVHNLIISSSAILNAPDQLIKKSIQKKATILINDAQTAKSFSPLLSRLIIALNEMLTSYTTPLEIVVLSDNKTFVEVKSIGQVGTVEKKTIQLVPGDYVFEGKRQGFVTINLPVKLRPGDSGKQFLVIAHEKI